MPYVNIRITREGATPAQKAALIKGVTDLLSATLGKNPATTVVVIDEVELEDWGMGGLPIIDFRKKLSSQTAGAES
jgi:4-oxalocrotonate tautomerase